MPPAGQSRPQALHFSGVECFPGSWSRSRTGGSVAPGFLLSVVGGLGGNEYEAVRPSTNRERLADAHRIGGLYQNDGENPEKEVECSECSKMADSQPSLVLSPLRKDHWTHRLAAGCKKSLSIGWAFRLLLFNYYLTKLPNLLSSPVDSSSGKVRSCRFVLSLPSYFSQQCPVLPRSIHREARRP